MAKVEVVFVDSGFVSEERRISMTVFPAISCWENFLTSLIVMDEEGREARHSVVSGREALRLMEQEREEIEGVVS